MNDPFDAAARHHLTIERFLVTAVDAGHDQRWRSVRIRVDRDDCSLVELMFRVGGDSAENRCQLWLGDESHMSEGVVDGIAQIRLDERFLRIALDSEQGACLGRLSNLLVFELPSDPEACARLENVLIWAHALHRWDIRLSSMPQHSQTS